MKNNLFKKIIIGSMILATAVSISACSKAGSEEAPSVSTVTATSTPAPSVYTFAKGSKYGDLDIGGLTLEDAITKAENYLRENLNKVTVTVTFNNQSVDITGDAADITESNVKTELTKASQSKDKCIIEPTYTAECSEDAKKTLKSFRKSSQIKAENATITSFNSQTEKFKFKEGSNGKRMNIKKTLPLINEQFTKGESATIAAKESTVKPKVTVDMLENSYGLISSYETISTNTENGTHNMGLAAEKINGTILQPGEQFSFNDTVGDSTSEANGFLPANGIVNGVLTPVYGGGICQTSSTLYVAALYAGLQIDYRDCHSMPSSYVPIGLDATVDYNNIDFKFTNNYDTTIYIVAGMDGTTLYVKIYGVQPDDWDSIDVTSWTEETIYPDEGCTYVTDYSLAEGEVQLKASSMEGYKARAQRTYYKNGEVTYTEDLGESVYSARQTTYAVGPGTDTSKIVDGVYYGDSGSTDSTTDYSTDDSTDYSNEYSDSGDDLEITPDSYEYSDSYSVADETSYYIDGGTIEGGTEVMG